jgi:hypothetical protein
MAAAPQQLGSPEETFKQLGMQFDLHELVIKALLNEGCKTLEEFRFMFTNDSEVKSVIVDAIQDLPNAAVQSARLRRAWHAVTEAIDVQAAKAKPATEDDLDKLLDSTELNSLETQFWKRYHIRIPPELAPADSLVSRVAREMTRRQLQVKDVWSVKTLHHQVMRASKKRKLAGGLYLQDDEDDPVVMGHSSEAYLDCLFTYLVALAKAGVTAVPTAPASVASPPAQAAATVQAPLDVLLKYYFRCKLAAARQPEGARLAWMMRCDVADRTEWVAAYRLSETITLGEVVESTYQKRDAHWSGAPGTASTAQQQRQNPQLQAPAPQGAPEQTRTQPPGKHAAALRDGTPLCAAYQHKKCPEKTRSCPKGAHKCAMVLKSGRVCGSSLHGAANCDNKRK